MTTTIEQYCSVCKAVLAMSVVPTADGDEDGVLWLRCPRCHGFLPKLSDGGDERRRSTDQVQPDVVDEPVAAPLGPPEARPRGQIPAEPDSSPEPLPDFDPALAVSYRPWGRYEEGAVVHHLAWDDYGIVLAKETLPGGRRAVKVQFEKAGVVRLIEESDEGS